VYPLHLEDRFHETGILDETQGLRLGDADALSKLLTALQEIEQRPTSAQDFLAAHQAWLRWQYQESPVFGQEPFALKDVYIETECGKLPWSEINDSGQTQRVDAFQESRGGREVLLDSVLERIADPAFKDLVVVQAGPGSGKSAFTLRLANELADHGFWPILVRFRDLRLATFPDVAELLDDAIRIGPADEDSPNLGEVGEPIVSSVLGIQHQFRGSNLCKAVFILDGWDEVSLTGNVS
jgi:hypothetical protein